MLAAASVMPLKMRASISNVPAISKTPTHMSSQKGIDIG
jgi:hypothetical protein